MTSVHHRAHDLSPSTLPSNVTEVRDLGEPRIRQKWSCSLMKSGSLESSEVSTWENLAFLNIRLDSEDVFLARALWTSE